MRPTPTNRCGLYVSGSGQSRASRCNSFNTITTDEFFGRMCPSTSGVSARTFRAMNGTAGISRCVSRKAQSRNSSCSMSTGWSRSNKWLPGLRAQLTAQCQITVVAHSIEHGVHLLHHPFTHSRVLPNQIDCPQQCPTCPITVDLVLNPVVSQLNRLACCLVCEQSDDRLGDDVRPGEDVRLRQVAIHQSVENSHWLHQRACPRFNIFESLIHTLFKVNLIQLLDSVV